MKFLISCAVLLSCCLALGQQAAGPLAFEVASIKPAAQPVANRGGRAFVRVGMSTDGGMLRYTNVGLKDVIRAAYKVKEFQIEGPDWLGNARFDITAKFPEGATEKQVPEMLQALLAERFKLALHRESKESPIYALVVGKGGPKLKAAEVPVGDTPALDKSPRTGAQDVAVARPGGNVPVGMMRMMMDPSGMHFQASSVTLAGLAEAISRFTERPVMDMTEIKGQYDFELVFAPETMRGVRVMGGPPPAGGDRGAGDNAPAEPAESIFDAVQRYGLKLEPRKAPIEVLVIDHIEKTPTEN
jgi:uncharacterized protein (TIGR03435 family)